MRANARSTNRFIPTLIATAFLVLAACSPSEDTSGGAATSSVTAPPGATPPPCPTPPNLAVYGAEEEPGPTTPPGPTPPPGPTTLNINFVSPALGTVYSTATPPVEYTITEDGQPLPCTRLNFSLHDIEGDLNQQQYVNTRALGYLPSGSSLPAMENGWHGLEFEITNPDGTVRLNQVIAFATATQQPAITNLTPANSRLID